MTMITNYIKSSFRNITRYRLFSSINIIGFAASMSIGLLLISILNDISSYDNFNVKKNKIYRVISYNTENDKVVQLATTSVRTGRRIRETMPGIEDLTIVRYGFGGDFTHEDITMSVNGLWAEQSFFNVFSFGLLKGDPKTALLEPFSIVLTEEIAKKLFGDSEPLGKTISLKNNGFEKGRGKFKQYGKL